LPAKLDRQMWVMPGAPMSAMKPTAYSDSSALPQSPMVGFTNAWFA
jgi:hypothetical protein